MELFDKIERTFMGYSNHNENPYNFFNRSGRKEFSIVRETLNEWFRQYPNEEKLELKNSFKKKFDDCFYELFLYQLFKKLGFEIKVHPDLPNTSKKPDFLLKKGTLEFYAEAKIIKNKSHQQEALNRKINEFYDNLSKLDSKGFLLNIDTFILKSQKQPSTKGLKKRIEEVLEKLDPDLVIEKISTEGFESLPVFEIENENINLKIKFFPIDKSARDEKKSPIGMYLIQSFWGGGEESLKDAIKYKAKRYGKLEKPFIVCINSLDIKTSGTHSIENAIWGSLAISWSTDQKNRNEKWIRLRDGVFLGEKEPNLKNLSGILITKVFPHNISNANYWFFKHPFSENELDFDSVGLKFSYVENGQIISVLGDDLGEILQIENDWLDK